LSSNNNSKKLQTSAYIRLFFYRDFGCALPQLMMVYGCQTSYTDRAFIALSFESLIVNFKATVDFLWFF